ncbi:hypothetical protein ACSVIJ_04415 [Pseudomonas sp. NCHU5208]|uniref:hypothetical protein n=1 Tax=unclassified Pseudomonas TaxID=196821 RepID=UPI003F9E0C06
MIQRGSNLAVTKLASYAEDPAAFIKAGGKPYNAKAAREGTKAHQRIGASPSKLRFILLVAAILGALLYLGVIKV